MSDSSCIQELSNELDIQALVRNTQKGMSSVRNGLVVIRECNLDHAADGLQEGDFFPFTKGVEWLISAIEMNWEKLALRVESDISDQQSKWKIEKQEIKAKATKIYPEEDKSTRSDRAA